MRYWTHSDGGEQLRAYPTIEVLGRRLGKTFFVVLTQRAETPLGTPTSILAYTELHLPRCFLLCVLSFCLALRTSFIF